MRDYAGKNGDDGRRRRRRAMTNNGKNTFALLECTRRSDLELSEKGRSNRTSIEVDAHVQHKQAVGTRRRRQATLTIAIAFIGPFIGKIHQS